ncbi:hypothetical protein [Anaeromassilibacillus senegalensis]|uniref:hypothetical protein n=1 Tax=Anaeromassilibacillus senegalensis TaxID=1673717 RepID=UPI0006833D87|nr:hypothetical protein [Anaeromassilibacillus senegalensis]
MAGSILVTDGLGNTYEATYPRRAKQLVKKGRARFVGPDRICLACPPKRLEEPTMAEYKAGTQDILERIDRILNDTAYLKDALMTIEKIPQQGSEGEAARLKAEAVAQIVNDREETNRQALRLLELLAGGTEPEEAETAGEEDEDAEYEYVDVK